MESVSSNVRNATETEDVFKPGNMQEADLKLDDGSSTAVPTSTVMDQENGQHSSVPEKRANSLWAYIHIILSCIYVKTLLLINVRNRFAGLLSFPVFKTTKRSDASSQTDPPPVRETRAVFSQTVASARANAASQTATLATETVASQTVTPATNAAAGQTDATHSHVAAVQTDETSRVATSVQTDAPKHDAVATQTDARTSTAVAAVQTDSAAVAVAARTRPNDVRLTYNTFSQTDRAASRESVAAQTDRAASRESVAVQTDRAASRESVAAQTDRAAFCESVAAQTDRAAFCGTVACQTDSAPSAGRTDSAPRGDNEKRCPVAVSVAVQTDRPACDAAQHPRRDGGGADAVNELLAKFGRRDRKARTVNKSPVNLKTVLKKIGLNGFESLSFREMSFTHQKIIDNSVTLCNRYKSLMETAVKHLPCLQRGSVKQKRDIIHVFATLDEMLYSKNNELDTYKIDLASEIEKRIAVEKQYAAKIDLLSKTKMNHEQLVAKNKTLLQSGNSKTDRNGHADKLAQQSSNLRGKSYAKCDGITAGKLLRRPENKNTISKKKSK